MDGPEERDGGTEDDLPRLLIVIASTRPGRVGLPVSEWVREQAERHGGFNAPLKNAIDFLVQEWGYKPVGLVSYGGVAGGTRAVQLLKPVLAGLRMTPLTEAVPIPFVPRLIDEQGRLQATEQMDESARGMFDALARWVPALRSLRATTVGAK